MQPSYEDNTYRCRLLRVVDGDTLQLQVDLGLRCERNLYIRLVGMNAPETRGEERELGKAASEHAQKVFNKLSATGKPVYVQFQKGKSFDRWLGRVFVVMTGATILDFSEEMIKDGHAKPFEP